MLPRGQCPGPFILRNRNSGPAKHFNSCPAPAPGPHLYPRLSGSDSPRAACKRSQTVLVLWRQARLTVRRGLGLIPSCPVSERPVSRLSGSLLFEWATLCSAVYSSGGHLAFASNAALPVWVSARLDPVCSSPGRSGAWTIRNATESFVDPFAWFAPCASRPAVPEPLQSLRILPSTHVPPPPPSRPFFLPLCRQCSSQRVVR